MTLKRLLASAATVLSMLLSTSTLAETSLPEVSHDGLHLLKHTKLRAVYMKPGANLDAYDKVALLEAYVAFKKNWQRNQNAGGRINKKLRASWIIKATRW